MHRENKDGSYNVRGYGGARPGSGPKPTGRKPHSFYITEEEHEMLMRILLRHRDYVRDLDKPEKSTS